MTTHDPHSLLGPYVLDAVDADERAAFEDHLATCETCREELRGFQETAARLGETAEVAAQASLRDSVLTAVRQTPQQRPVVSLGAHRARRRLPQLVAAAAVVLALAGGSFAVVEHQQASTLQAQQSDVSSVLGASDASMTSTRADGGGALRVITSATEDAAVVSGASLPALDRDRVYQLWTMHDGVPMSAGLLDRGHGSVLVAKLGSTDALAVTSEPAGGSKKPTTDPVAIAPLRS